MLISQAKSMVTKLINLPLGLFFQAYSYDLSPSDHGPFVYMYMYLLYRHILTINLYSSYNFHCISIIHSVKKKCYYKFFVTQCIRFVARKYNYMHM